MLLQLRAATSRVEVRAGSPAMQAGLVSKRLCVRDIFTATAVRIVFVLVRIDIEARLNDNAIIRLAA